MPRRNEHNEVCVAKGIPMRIGDMVNRIKDSTAHENPCWHRGDFHGAGKNWPFLLFLGFQGYRAALLHDRLDRLESFRKRGISGLSFLPERMFSRHPGKLLEESHAISFATR